jgi:ubiquinone/menaquinone biosynthesis C-methylase UbiE
VRLAVLKGSESVLDVGCGSGWMLRTLSRRGISRLYGVDLSRGQYVKGESAELSPSTFAEGDCYSLPFKNGSVDVVLMTEVLEHLEAPADAIKEGARVLKKGGKLLVSVPWNEKLRYTLCIHCNELTPINAHVQSFSSDRLIKMLEEAGLEVVRENTSMNRGLQYLRMHVLFKFLPAALWSLLDRSAGLFLNRWANICVRADKPS